MLGELVKAVGLRGEVKLRESQDFWVEALESGKLALSTPGGRCAVGVVSQREHKPGTRVLRLEGVEDREAAEALVGAEIVLGLVGLDVSEAKSLRSYQLRGLRVLLPDGRVLGDVTDVLDLPAHDVLVVHGDGRDYLIPGVPEIVRGVDLESGHVRVEPPPGLLEL